ncbi:cupin domain-containing protein [Frondihabitans sucicola]|uniref:cupin domain-containing protein n=1 Tax=Frondihabitans sucicola TaxID=1268041 RepID=UPI003305CF11
MDAISKVLRDAQLEAVLERHCRLGASTRMDIVGPGTKRIPFHVLLEGECLLVVNGRELHLTAGDVVIIPSGAAHRIVTAGPAPLTGTSEKTGTNFVSTTSVGGGPPVIDLFCGFYTAGPGAGAILAHSLPDPLQVSLGDTGPDADFLTNLSNLLRGKPSTRDGEHRRSSLPSALPCWLSCSEPTPRLPRAPCSGQPFATPTSPGPSRTSSMIRAPTGHSHGHR